jgi:hypothetical protein
VLYTAVDITQTRFKQLKQFLLRTGTPTPLSILVRRAMEAILVPETCGRLLCLLALIRFIYRIEGECRGQELASLSITLRHSCPR